MPQPDSHGSGTTGREPCASGAQAPATDRRGLLAWVARISAGATAVALGLPGLGYLTGPLRAKTQSQWVAIGDAGALATDTPQAVSFRYEDRTGYRRSYRSGVAWGRAVDGEVRVLSPVCTHKGCNVSFDARSVEFVCPCHGGRYTSDGAVASGPPPRPLERYQTKVERGMLWIQVGPDGTAA